MWPREQIHRFQLEERRREIERYVWTYRQGYNIPVSRQALAEMQAQHFSDVEEMRRRTMEGEWPTGDTITYSYAGGGCNPEADERAEALLLEHLDDEQKLQWKEWTAFNVEGSEGGFYTVLLNGDVEGNGGNHYCLQPTERMPRADACLAKKLLIETDEKEFLNKANLLGRGWR